MRLTLAPIALCLLVACSGGPETPPAAVAPAPAPPTDEGARRIEADVAFLADDLLEGRAAGTRGYDLAARYVASRYRAIGLAPAGDDGSYFQKVPLLEARRVREGAAFTMQRDDGDLSFVFQDEFLPGLNFNATSHVVNAPLVFVGQAVHAPELGHDDFEGVDLRGKVAVYFSGAPATFGNTQRAFHSSGLQKMGQLASRGAVGAIGLGNPVDEAKYPWARGARNWQMPGMRLVDAEGKPVDAWPELKATASLGVDGARKLLAGAPMPVDEIFERREKGTLESFDLPGRVTLAGATELKRVDSVNVVAKLEGSDPVLAGEHIAYSAHLDHIGLGAEVDGDGIYNGAFDNALGIAVMLEAATELQADANKPKRSALFVAVTAEERGLLGADYFAKFPTVPRESLVANINMDMPVFLTDVTDVVPIGVEHSTLEADVQAAAAQLGVGLTPDPKPEEVVFVRSDQYAFVRQGIPAVYLDAGIKARNPDVDALALYEDFLTGHYHQPSDETNLSIHYPSAAMLARLNAEIGRRVGNADTRPAWKEGDFFGKTFAGQ
ncbi:M28 family metallopeptidase [Arenimonas sp.]|uniref:M28 family metallopeptidase n=1 Tax=Arenimonas sp. TaxID=1872635 RepID=UPI002E364319|nr:M20/M25/M40 family metallo-hydrolase [Arenimonas sp.]HEX4854308.1 M20/M25/M40 family metallo-hydrolase [Arenimonas sp.]